MNQILERQILATSMQNSFETEDPSMQSSFESEGLNTSFQDCQLVNENPLHQGAKSQNGEKNLAESAEYWTENVKRDKEESPIRIA